MSKWFVRYETASGRVRDSAVYSDASAAALAAGLDPTQAAIISDPPSSAPGPSEIWVVDGQVVDIDQADQAVVEATLTPEAIAKAEGEIDNEYGRKLGAVASSQPEILTIYPRKEAQARAYLADPPASPVAADWPWLAAEVGATTPDTGDPAVDLPAAATLIVGMADAWEAYAAACESVRLSAKAQARAAGTRAEVQAVLDNLSWPAAPAQ